MIEQVIYAVDDDRRFLSALERSLRSTGLTVNSYSSAREFLDDLDPDQSGCLITDICMPDIGGIELQRQLLERQIVIPIIFITGQGDTATAVTALKNGAVDFLEKPFSEKQLLGSVDRALRNDARDRKRAHDRAILEKRCDSLSPREREVLIFVVADRPNKEIARELQISPRTVEHHREHVMLKMRAGSQAELITMAVLCGLHELHLET